jgi:predicted component of viral defense system (DUF524 family)
VYFEKSLFLFCTVKITKNALKLVFVSGFKFQVRSTKIKIVTRMKLIRYRENADENGFFFWIEIAVGIEMESFCDKNGSNTATRKRPAEASEVLVLLRFYCKT